MVRTARAAVAGAALAVLLAGCQKTPPPIVEASGVIRLDGKPLNKVQVRFIPMDGYGAEYMAAGVTDEAGRFQLTCNGKPGACACEHRVVVTEADIPPRLQSENAQAELARYLDSLGGRPIPPKYSNLADSPLEAKVTAGRAEYDFDLTR
jgi:hypothetical protein